MERTPLLNGSLNRNPGDGVSGNIGQGGNLSNPIRPFSAPPVRRNVYQDDSDDDLFFTHGSVRSRTSLGEREECLGRSLNRQRSGGNVDEEFLNRDTNRKNEVSKSKVMNMVLMNIILIIWSIANHIHSPVYSQYLYRRIMGEVFGNSSVESKNHSNINSTECFKPTLNTSGSDGAYSLQEKAQQLSAEINMQLSLSSSAFSFISTVLFGAYSDYFGRKMLFLIPLFGHLVDYIMVTLIIYWELDIKLFFVTGCISGICTSEIFNIACYAYIADNTPPKGSRTMGLAVVGVSEYLTSAALSTGVGYYIQLEGYALPSLTAAAILVLAIIAVICILPERKRIPADPTEREKLKDEKSKLNPLRAIRSVFGFYIFDGSFKTKSMFTLCLIAYFAHEIAMKTGNIGTLWEMNYPLCWTPEMMGYYGTGSSLFSELIKLPLLKLLQCCLKDEFIAIWSNVIYTGSVILKSFSTDDLMMYGVAFMTAFDVSVTTVIKSISSRMAGPDRQGAMFASFAIVSILCTILGTPAFSELYKYTLNIFRGMSYLVSAGVQCICTACLIVFAVLEAKGYKKDTEVINMKDNQSNQQASTAPHTEDSTV